VKLNLLVFVSLTMCFVTCGNQVDAHIDLSNPQNKAVQFEGCYFVGIKEGLPISGTTPQQYTESAHKGDRVTGSVRKSDTTELTDTLHLQITFNSDGKFSQKVTTYLDTIRFDLIVE